MSLFKDDSIPHEEMAEIENRLTRLENAFATNRELLEEWKLKLKSIKKLLSDLELNILENRKEGFMMEFRDFNRKVSSSETMEKEDLEDTP